MSLQGLPQHCLSHLPKISVPAHETVPEGVVEQLGAPGGNERVGVRLERAAHVRQQAHSKGYSSTSSTNAFISASLFAS